LNSPSTIMNYELWIYCYWHSDTKLFYQISFVFLRPNHSPKKITRMTVVESVGFMASLLSVLNQFPQAIKVFQSKDTHSISLLMYCIVVVCITLWMVYGILLHDGPLIWANLLSLFPITYIFLMKVRNTIIGKDKLSI